MTRYAYASGYKTRERAQEVLEDLYAEGTVSDGEKPKIEPYRAHLIATGEEVTRWRITLED